MGHKGTSLEKVDRAIWQGCKNVLDAALTSLSMLTSAGLTFQEIDPRLVGSLDGYEAKIVIQRLGLGHIKGRGEGSLIADQVGDDVEVIIDGETLSGPAEFQLYEEEFWILAQYQATYLTKHFAVDRVLNEQLVKAFSRKYVTVETGCDVLIWMPSPTAITASPQDDGIFEKIIPWNVEVPLKVKATETVKTILSFALTAEPKAVLPTSPV